MADDSSPEGSDDDPKSKEEHSGDVLKDGENEKEEKEKKEKEEKKKKEENNKNKNTNEEKNDDEDDDSKLNTYDIDKWFLGDSITKKPSENDNLEKTTISPPGSLFDSKTKSPEVSPTEPPKDESETKNDSQGQSGTGPVGGNPFHPYPRPVDIWDRLFVLAAFPICFFAVMLKAEMFR